MAVFNLGILSQVINSSFLYGFLGGISVAWVFLKSRLRIHGENTVLSPECAPTCFEPVGYGEDSFKLALIVRTDLKMGKGKAAAQCSHAAVMAYERTLRHQPTVLRQWQACGQAKVVLKVETEHELLELAREARNKGLVTSLVCDAGHTQVAPGSKTVLGIGPGPVNVVDSVSGHLKLF